MEVGETKEGGGERGEEEGQAETLFNRRRRREEAGRQRDSKILNAFQTSYKGMK